MTQTPDPAAVDVQEPPASDPAPHGLDPEGRPYQSDPGALRGMPRRINPRRGVKVSPIKRTRPTAKKTAPAKATPAAPETHGQRIAKWAGVGAALVDRRVSPVHGSLVRMWGAQAGPLIDQVVAEDPRIGRWLDKLNFGMGGAKSELLATSGVYVAAGLVQGGMRHPLLMTLTGGILTQAAVGAAVRTWAAERAGLRYDTTPGAAMSLGELRLMYGDDVDQADVERVNELVAGYLTPPEPEVDSASTESAPEGATLPA